MGQDRETEEAETGRDAEIKRAMDHKTETEKNDRTTRRRSERKQTDSIPELRGQSPEDVA